MNVSDRTDQRLERQSGNGRRKTSTRRNGEIEVGMARVIDSVRLDERWRARGFQKTTTRRNEGEGG